MLFPSNAAADSIRTSCTLSAHGIPPHFVTGKREVASANTSVSRKGLCREGTAPAGTDSAIGARQSETYKYISPSSLGVI